MADAASVPALSALRPQWSAVCSDSTMSTRFKRSPRANTQHERASSCKQTAAVEFEPLTLAASATVSDGPPRPPPNLFHVEQAKPHPLLQSIKLKLLNGSFRMPTNPSRWEQVVDHHNAHHEPNVSHVLKPILIPNPVVQKAAAVLLAFRS